MGLKSTRMLSWTVFNIEPRTLSVETFMLYTYHRPSLANFNVRVIIIEVSAFNVFEFFSIFVKIHSILHCGPDSSPFNFTMSYKKFQVLCFISGEMVLER